MSEKRSFTIDKNILYSIIQSQAGTLEKAILEGVQNSFDAGSSSCNILIDKKSFSISDDGKGFSSMSEIKNFFECFGTPHVAGDAKFGKFRMGRGQIFSYGINSWVSGDFEMLVDIKNEGLDYSLSESTSHFSGCDIKVSLYERLTNSELDAVVRNISKMVKYLAIPVSINGVIVSTNPSTMKWDIETDDAYIKIIDTGELGVWHEGIFIRDYGNYQFGVSGVVVAKNQFEVNFARNDIMTSKCKMWKRISSKLKAFGKSKVVKKTRLSDGERQMIVNDIISGESSFSGMKKMKLITDTVGRNWELQKITKIVSSSYFGGGTSLCLEDGVGSRFAETIHQKESFVLSKYTLDLWGVSSVLSLMTLFDKLHESDCEKENSRQDKDFYRKALIEDIEDIKSKFSNGYIQLSDEDLTSHELAVIRSLRERVSSIRYVFYRTGVTDDFIKHRDILAGSSEQAEAWTDGCDKIWINKTLLSDACKGFPEYMALCSVLAHEFMHHEADDESHIHGQEFYSGFHSVLTSHEFYSDSLQGFKYMIAECRRKNIRVYANTGKNEDVLDSFEDITVSAKGGVE